MKKSIKFLAVIMACMFLFAGCNQKKPQDTPASTTPTESNPPVATKPVEEEKEEVKEPEKDPKEEILAKAEEDKEAMLEVMNDVVATYRSGELPDYYAEYPAKESYPDLSSADNLSLSKGDSDSDIYINVKVGNQNMAVALQYVEGSETPWMVVGTSFSGVKG